MKDFNAIQEKVNFLSTFIDKLPVNNNYVDWWIDCISPYAIRLGGRYVEHRDNISIYFEIALYNNFKINISIDPVSKSNISVNEWYIIQSEIRKEITKLIKK